MFTFYLFIYLFILYLSRNDFGKLLRTGSNGDDLSRLLDHKSGRWDGLHEQLSTRINADIVSANFGDISNTCPIVESFALTHCHVTARALWQFSYVGPPCAVP